MKRIRLGDLCNIYSGGDKPKVFSKFKTGDCSIPVYANGTENNGIVGYTNKATILNKAITVAARGSCGSVFFRDVPYVPIIRLISIIPKDTEGIDTKYLYYLLKLRQFKSTGSVQSQITVPEISDYNLDFIEDITTQHKIGRILSLIDTKIETNNKINKSLQDLIQTIYDYWFLQFEFPNEEGKPYKSSGGKMVYNEQLKKEIPKNWVVKTLGEILDENRLVFDYNSTEKCIDLSVMLSNNISLNDYNSSENFSTNLYKLNTYDILFGSIRPYLKKCGIAPFNGVFAGTLISYSPKKMFDYNLALATLSSETMFRYAIKNSTGTKMPVVSSDKILEFKIAYNEKTSMNFNFIDIKKLIVKNVNENQKLSEIRDFLLPLLMNGQVTFKDDKEEFGNKVEQAIILSYAERFSKWKQEQGYAARGDVDDEILKKIFDAMDEDDKK